MEQSQKHFSVLKKEHNHVKYTSKHKSHYNIFTQSSNFNNLMSFVISQNQKYVRNVRKDHKIYIVLQRLAFHYI